MAYIQEIKRHPAQVGDFIQYRFTSGQAFGRALTALTCRKVTEVIDGGAIFVCDDKYRVSALQITAHIPMHQTAAKSDDDLDDDDFGFCGVKDGLR